MGVTRAGRHFPRATFRRWRDGAVAQVSAQVARHDGLPICAPCHAMIAYHPGDRRRRDVPAILDALWHVLERAGVVADDALLTRVTFETRPVCKARPRVSIALYVGGA